MCYSCKGTKVIDILKTIEGKEFLRGADAIRFDIENSRHGYRRFIIPCDCAPNEIIKEFIATLPIEYKRFSENYPDEKVRRAVFADTEERKITVLSGGTGNGKTWCSVNVAIHWKLEGKRVSYLEAHDLAKNYFSSMDHKSFYRDEGDSYMSRLGKWIIINDLGRGESGRDDFGECLRFVMDNMHGVLITTNLGAADFLEKYGDEVLTYFKPDEDDAIAYGVIEEKLFKDIGDRRYL